MHIACSAVGHAHAKKTPVWEGKKTKLTNLKNLEQFEYSPDMLGTYHRQDRRQNVLPADQERTLSAPILTTTVSRALSISGFSSKSSALQLIRENSGKKLTSYFGMGIM